MAEPVGALRAELSANAARFEDDMRRARQAVRGASQDMTRNMESFRSRAEHAVRSIVNLRNAAVLAAGATGLFMLTRRAIEAADQIGKTAERIGVTTDALQELRFAASQAGVAQTALEGGLQRLAVQAAQAAQGTGEAANTFRRLGIDVTDTNGRVRDTQGILRDVADALSRNENATERLADATRLFGREAGGQFVSLLRDGAAGLDRMAAKAREMGLVMDRDLIQRATEANDKLDIMSKIVGTRMTEALLNLTPLVSALAEAFADLSKQAGLAFEGFRPLLERSVSRLEYDLERAQTKLAGMREELRRLEEAGGAVPLDTMRHALREQESLVGQLEARLAFLKGPPEGLTLSLQVAPEVEAPPVPPARPEIERERAVALIVAQRDAVAEYIETLREELRLQKLSAAERQKAEAIARAQNIAIGEGTLLTLEQIAAIEGVIEAGQAWQAQVSELARAEEEHRRQQAAGVRQVEMYGDALAYSVERAAFATGKLSDAVQDLGLSLARLVFREAITQPLASAIAGALSGGIGNLFGGARAMGGPVARGKMYLVGERGPELFAPGAPGQIVPNAALGGGGGNVQVTVVNQTGVEADARVSRTQTGGVDELVVTLERRMASRLAGQGGDLSRAIENTFGLSRRGR